MLGISGDRTIQAGTIVGAVNQGNVGGNLTQNVNVSNRPTIRLDLPPKDPLPKEQDFLKLLSWQTPIGPLVGRDHEISDLMEWIDSESAVRVRLLSGPGGAGKGRL